ncbi:hypothetical protein [Paracidovorax wautersii]|uniref:Uncharacterized protein n=1 Tax=Paracidovorax wautersii TaxID=1177982 RepID=A0A1I2GDA7_9BURK|nr:hypothetical protein [Paracidovorax wautersii]SFF14726.1 hypothetical protein SAMN04489711_11456 [Paracidovorax wautersii]
MPAASFTGEAYASSITVTAVSDDPRDIAAAWLQGRSASAVALGDSAAMVESNGLVDARGMAVSAEGAVEWYAGGRASMIDGSALVALPGVSRMILPPLPHSQSRGYVLVFHPADKDCALQSGSIAAGGPTASTVVAGSICQSGSNSALLWFAAQAGADGSLDMYLRAVDAQQQIHLFERSVSDVLQDVLLATVDAGQTLRLQFAPSPTFVPYAEPKTVSVEAAVAWAEAVQPLRVAGLDGPALALDAEFGGAGRVWGTTAIKGSPDVPVRARVLLLRQRDKLVAREVWSDPVTGAFEFRGIDPSQAWLTLAEDASGNFRPVAASNLTAQVSS